MCNLYAMARGRGEIARLFVASRDYTANQPILPAVFPDQLAPVVRIGGEGLRVMETMCWGFPPPKLGSRPVTNVRNTASRYWRGWLKPEFRCLVPATSFCEYTDSQPKVPHWFAIGDDRPAFAFAGLWRPWTGTRKGENGEHRLFAFLTTEANGVVQTVHAKAMPVILTEETWETWLTASEAEALGLQRPFPAEQLKVVATGQRQDGPPLEPALPA